MIPFLASFVPVAAFTFFAEAGSDALRRQRNELLPLLNFEPFVYVLYVVTGVSMLIRHLVRFAQWFASWFIVPFGGALTGWGCGLTVAVLLRGEWRVAIGGIALTVAMGAFALAPAVIAVRALSLADRVCGRLFRTRAHVLAINGIALVLIELGIVGLWGLYDG